MQDVQTELHRLGGIATRGQLVETGVSDRRLRQASTSGEILRVRQGWYATLPSDDPRVVAVAAGGRLTGLAALRLADAWLWKNHRLVDVLLPPGAGARSAPWGVRLSRGTASGAGVVVPLREVLLNALPRVPFEEAVAVLDWARHTGRLDDLDLHAVVAALPRRLQQVASWTDDRCESVLESIVRTRLRRAGFRVTSQVPVGFVQAIDLVVDDVVGVELDGYTYHRDSFESDRSKDLRIVTEGRTAIRASYRLVRDEWPRVVVAIEAAVAAHRSGRQRRRRDRGPEGMPPAEERFPPS